MAKSPTTDVFTPYEAGMNRLLERLGSDHPHYAEATTLQSRLLDNIAHARRYGETETRRADRAQIMDSLNCLALETLAVSFNELSAQKADVVQEAMLSPEESAWLRKNLVRYFNKEELRTLCSDLGVDYDNLGGEGKEDRARELIAYLDRRERIPEIIEKCRELRPLVDDWEWVTRVSPGPPASEFPEVDYPQPGGTQPPGSPVYVRRAIDDVFERAVLRSGNIIIIRGHTNTGKSSLLAGGLAYAKEAGRHLIRPDLQDAVRIARLGPDHADDFFLEIATSIWWAMGESRQGLDRELPRKVWSSLSARNRLLGFVKNYVLVNFDERVVLAMDKVNRILNTSLGDDFHELIVTWQDDIVNNRPVWDKLTIVITFSTESYLLADDITPLRWPFGTVIDMPDFSQEEIQCLKQRYSNQLAQVRLARVKVQDVARLLGGHPYLTHIALDEIAQGKVRDWQELNEIAVDEEHSPFREHLGRRYDRIGMRPELGLVEALRQIVREHTCCDQKLFLRLESAGLVRRESQGYYCRYGLYERYFSSRL